MSHFQKGLGSNLFIYLLLFPFSTIVLHNKILLRSLHATIIKFYVHIHKLKLRYTFDSID